MLRKASAIICMILFSTGGLLAQNTVVQGRVTLFNTYSLNDIVVSSKKAKTSITTDSLGYFMLNCKEKDVIQIQSKGFLSASKKVQPDMESMDFNLVFKDTPKYRKYVVEMGHISQQDLDYGLKYLMQENNDYCSYEDIFSLIRSKFTEVDVRASSSGGQGIYLRRGTKSMTLDTQMIYVVDGQRLRDISYINPCEIAAIKVLSEVTAAKYGAGSSNGALEITTKRSARSQ